MFRRPSVHYGRTPEAVTPYQKAAQVWDERIGSARIQARNWRLMAFGSLLLSGGLAAALVWQSTQGTITAADGLGSGGHTLVDALRALHATRPCRSPLRRW